jgi:hypothetical protein|tara:strand:+ start:746 stop:1144 length:399 start_codon:yes stop_codon:yes gene_type:complete
MIKESRTLLMRTLRSDSTLFNLIKGKIYPQDLATLKNPMYPCVTFTFGSGESDDNIPNLAESNVSVKCYSTKSYSECWNIYEKIRSLVLFSVVSDANVRMRITENGTPDETFNETDRLHIVVASLNLVIIGV